MHLLLSGRLAICHAESHRPQPTKHQYMLLAEKKMEEIERKNARLEHFQERAQWNAIWHNHPTSPENAQNMTKPVTTKHKHMLLAEKKVEEIERKNARLGTLPEKSPVECHSVRLPPSLKLFSGYSTCSEPLETKKAADTTTQPAQKIDNMTNSMTTKHTHMLLAEKKMEEIERRNARLGTLPGESPVECHSVRFPPSLKLFSGYSTCSEPLETRKAADTTTQPAQKMDNMTKPVTTKHKHMLLAEKKVEEIERKNAKAGNTSRREPSGMPFHEISPKCEIILGVFDVLGTPGNKKGS